MSNKHQVKQVYLIDCEIENKIKREIKQALFKRRALCLRPIDHNCPLASPHLQYMHDAGQTCLSKFEPCTGFKTDAHEQ